MKLALIGEKLSHSYSRIVHEKFFKYRGIDSTYELIEIPKHGFEENVASMINSGISGFNITIPYKIDILSLCTECSDEVKSIGAANTVKINNDKLYAYNTDYHGLKLSLDVAGIDLKNKRALILGTGGASRAVQVLCTDMGCLDVTIVSRTPKTTGDIKEVDYNHIPVSDIVFNTTPVGMFPNIGVSPIESLEGYEAAVDLIYNPATTLFMEKAQNCGIKTIGGLYMLVAQALYSQSIWRDEKPDFDMIDRIYKEMRDEL